MTSGGRLSQLDNCLRTPEICDIGFDPCLATDTCFEEYVTCTFEIVKDESDLFWSSSMLAISAGSLAIGTPLRVEPTGDQLYIFR